MSEIRFLGSFLSKNLKTNQLEVNTDEKTSRPIARLKEPRDLFALPKDKEHDCPQQAPRWPTECQVIEERIYHIPYVPPRPEPLNSKIGELKPRPVGEENGIVVFNYNPIGAVNYNPHTKGKSKSGDSSDSDSSSESRSSSPHRSTPDQRRLIMKKSFTNIFESMAQDLRSSSNSMDDYDDEDEDEDDDEEDSDEEDEETIIERLMANRTKPKKKSKVKPTKKINDMKSKAVPKKDTLQPQINFKAKANSATASDISSDEKFAKNGNASAQATSSGTTTTEVTTTEGEIDDIWANKSPEYQPATPTFIKSQFGRQYSKAHTSDNLSTSVRLLSPVRISRNKVTNLIVNKLDQKKAQATSQSKKDAVPSLSKPTKLRAADGGAVVSERLRGGQDTEKTSRGKSQPISYTQHAHNHPAQHTITNLAPAEKTKAQKYPCNIGTSCEVNENCIKNLSKASGDLPLKKVADPVKSFRQSHNLGNPSERSGKCKKSLSGNLNDLPTRTNAGDESKGEKKLETITNDLSLSDSFIPQFSRSAVGGAKIITNCHPYKPDEYDGLEFESRFESGNLAKAVMITQTYYELHLRPDLYTSRSRQWFYFRVKRTKKNMLYRFSIVNLVKQDSLYNEGMRPVMYSTMNANTHREGWKRCGDNIVYYRNEDDNNGNEEDDENSSYTLTFNIEFPHDNDTVYFAHSYPYTYSDLQDYLMEIQKHPVKSKFCKLRLLCRSLAGNNVYYLTVTAPTVDDEVAKRKKAVVISARVHPSETPASWMMKGLMDFITSDSMVAKRLRHKFIFKLIPMLNPDGVIVGNTRNSLTGKDLNRQYRTVIRETYPSIWYTKAMIKRLIDEFGVSMYCDMHAHSRRHNIFLYGCENKRNPEKKLSEQVFPLMMHKNCADKFSFENCKFKIQRSKEGTGRIVVWMLGITNSYTLEASFGGSHLGSRKSTHFHTGDYEHMGRVFCETLLDYHDENPNKVKKSQKYYKIIKKIRHRERREKKALKMKRMAEQERLRLKIIERLLKEGSSAEEPLNIPLSDYSSDEGNSSSSSDNEGKASSKFSDLEGPCCAPTKAPPCSPDFYASERRKFQYRRMQKIMCELDRIYFMPLTRRRCPVKKVNAKNGKLKEKSTRLKAGEDSSKINTNAKTTIPQVENSFKRQKQRLKVSRNLRLFLEKRKIILYRKKRVFRRKPKARLRTGRGLAIEKEQNRMPMDTPTTDPTRGVRFSSDEEDINSNHRTGMSGHAILARSVPCCTRKILLQSDLQRRYIEELGDARVILKHHMPPELIVTSPSKSAKSPCGHSPRSKLPFAVPNTAPGGTLPIDPKDRKSLSELPAIDARRSASGQSLHRSNRTVLKTLSRRERKTDHDELSFQLSLKNQVWLGLGANQLAGLPERPLSWGPSKGACMDSRKEPLTAFPKDQNAALLTACSEKLQAWQKLSNSEAHASSSKPRSKLHLESATASLGDNNEVGRRHKRSSVKELDSHNALGVGCGGARQTDLKLKKSSMAKVAETTQFITRLTSKSKSSSSNRFKTPIGSSSSVVAKKPQKTALRPVGTTHHIKLKTTGIVATAITPKTRRDKKLKSLVKSISPPEAGAGVVGPSEKTTVAALPGATSTVTTGTAKCVRQVRAKLRKKKVPKQSPEVEARIFREDES